MHFGLISHQPVLRFVEDHVELPLTGRRQDAQVAGPLPCGARDLPVRVDVLVQNDPVSYRSSRRNLPVRSKPSRQLIPSFPERSVQQRVWRQTR